MSWVTCPASLGRRAMLLCLAAAAIASASAQTAPETASPTSLIYYAGQAGRLTQDRDKFGGNPFASALVEVLKRQPATLSDFTADLSASNARHSGGWQQLQFPKKLPYWKWGAAEEKRVALVLINADYSKTPGVYSLPGAAFDAKRIPAALREAGFEVTLVLDKTADQARQAIAEFSALSASADASLIYIGGHGVQHKRAVYWMMGDYPERDAKWLPTHAISVDEIGRAGKATGLNLVLYASCRDDPFRN
jgi:caspase domain-containing protein